MLAETFVSEVYNLMLLDPPPYTAIYEGMEALDHLRTALHAPADFLTSELRAVPEIVEAMEKGRAFRKAHIEQVIHYVKTDLMPRHGIVSDPILQIALSYADYHRSRNRFALGPIPESTARDRAMQNLNENMTIDEQGQNPDIRNHLFNRFFFRHAQSEEPRPIAISQANLASLNSWKQKLRAELIDTVNTNILRAYQAALAEKIYPIFLKTEDGQKLPVRAEFLTLENFLPDSHDHLTSKFFLTRSRKEALVFETEGYTAPGWYSDPRKQFYRPTLANDAQLVLQTLTEVTLEDQMHLQKIDQVLAAINEFSSLAAVHQICESVAADYLELVRTEVEESMHIFGSLKELSRVWTDLHWYGLSQSPQHWEMRESLAHQGKRPVFHDHARGQFEYESNSRSRLLNRNHSISEIEERKKKIEWELETVRKNVKLPSYFELVESSNSRLPILKSKLRGHPDWEMRTRIGVSSHNVLPIPSAAGQQLAKLKLIDTGTKQALIRGKHFEILFEPAYNAYGISLYIQPHGDIIVNAGFKSGSAALPSASLVPLPANVLESIQESAQALGLKRFAQEVTELRRGSVSQPTGLHDVAEAFRRASYYSYRNDGTATDTRNPNDPKQIKKFVNDGYFCTQCANFASVFVHVLQSPEFSDALGAKLVVRNGFARSASANVLTAADRHSRAYAETPGAMAIPVEVTTDQIDQRGLEYEKTQARLQPTKAKLEKEKPETLKELQAQIKSIYEAESMIRRLRMLHGRIDPTEPLAQLVALAESLEAVPANDAALIAKAEQLSHSLDQAEQQLRQGKMTEFAAYLDPLVALPIRKSLQLIHSLAQACQSKLTKLKS